MGGRFGARTSDHGGRSFSTSPGTITTSCVSGRQRNPKTSTKNNAATRFGRSAPKRRASATAATYTTLTSSQERFIERRQGIIRRRVQPDVDLHGSGVRGRGLARAARRNRSAAARGRFLLRPRLRLLLSRPHAG